jgi:hypothetical protein
MALNCLAYLCLYGNIGDSSSFALLYVTTSLTLLADLGAFLIIYMSKEQYRQRILLKYTEWPPIASVVGLSGLYITSNLDGTI